MSINETIAEILRLDEEATPAEAWQPHVVSGDAAQYGQPGSRLKLNTCASWATGPNSRNTMQARTDAALIAYYRTAAPVLAREVQRLQGEVSHLLDARTSDRLQAHGGGYQDGHSAGQGAMRERAADACATEMERVDCPAYLTDDWEGVWWAGCASVFDTIRALEVEP